MYCRTHQPHSIHSVTWPRRLPACPLGGAEIFFSNSIFSATVKAISEIFSGSCAPRRALLKFRGHGGWGQIWVPGPPKRIFFNFFGGTSPGDGGRNLSYGNHSNGGPLWCLKFKKNRFFSRKLSSKFLRVGHYVEFAPLGAFVPTWPLEILVLGTLIIMVFVRGLRPPILGKYGVWPVCTLAHFFELRVWDFLKF